MNQGGPGDGSRNQSDPQDAGIVIIVDSDRERPERSAARAGKRKAIQKKQAGAGPREVIELSDRDEGPSVRNNKKGRPTSITASHRTAVLNRLAELEAVCTIFSFICCLI